MVEVCAFCGRPAECKHHLVFGTASRQLAEEDKLYIFLCNKHHNMGSTLECIHGNSAAQILSKMLGQAMYEKNHIAAGETAEAAREHFMQRYGRSYL